ncbi:uncharacterized protein LOC124774686 [Schistocerca piceifrons]|uniref:uncharacterized protein LOC124774686 n=1 Tax=Schistocerca piceifrons TaxID=274613 RepID=UPI001F5FC790|nr:uncharacterized protein LOC124774686 [Schistocerca piceifrons]
MKLEKNAEKVVSNCPQQTLLLQIQRTLEGDLIVLRSQSCSRTRLRWRRLILPERSWWCVSAEASPLRVVKLRDRLRSGDSCQSPRRVLPRRSSPARPPSSARPRTQSIRSRRATARSHVASQLETVATLHSPYCRVKILPPSKTLTATGIQDDSKVPESCWDCGLRVEEWRQSKNPHRCHTCELYV